MLQPEKFSHKTPPVHFHQVVSLRRSKFLPFLAFWTMIMGI